jgi:hypothetical protein
MTPELKAALEQIQKALEKMDPGELQAALQNFKINQEQFSKELDRMLELFQRIRIEQTVDELVKRLDDLAQRQESLDSRLDSLDQQDFDRMKSLSREESAICKDTEHTRDLTVQTRDEMTRFPVMPQQELTQFLEDFDQSQVQQDLQDARDALQEARSSAAREAAAEASKDLKQLAEQMSAFQQQFRQRTLADVMSDFKTVIGKVLYVSKLQESQNEKVRGVPRQSEEIMDAAIDQQQIQEQLSAVLNDLISLSMKTFSMSPRIGLQLGNAFQKMRQVISMLEERDPYNAAQQGGEATAALNSSVLELKIAMEQAQECGSACGFENYMKQLQQMAGQQQGLNNETQMLGLGQPVDGAALQRLAAQQQQVRKSLEQLQDEISQSTRQTGDLGGIAKDMDEVIQDLQNNRILRRTLERQQRILSRLLDAQKSLRAQDFKQERRSRTAEEYELARPGELPEDLGERRDFLQENLEQALRDGYTRPYEELIRLYFESLSTLKNR